MDTAHLCIARHGETDWNRLGILQGWLDVPLNAKGRAQAHELAKKIAAEGFAAVWTSPLARALDTAQLLCDALGLAAPQSHDGLRERHFGAVQGIPKIELAEQNPALLEQILRRNPAARFAGGESMDEFADRVLVAVGDIAEAHPGQRVLVVTHGWVMDAIARHAAGLPRHAVLHGKPKNGETSWVQVRQRTILAANA